ncbi:5-bromo-4-chloroindolyl phosphate hydrolysis family protein [uncultured Peptoniphilus sp.]|uniref:5-bromo-4-chloroindolyl phosphate hydrolysis family protein n=1 Tax=uncultured Peptoniphilus sp. TaxID=254354 RepID=UPI002806012F|nr:5-bromo-4-chloroindolyl phosphate hydrolysis family protein [uncultured Peptoniphilus sp.]
MKKYRVSIRDIVNSIDEEKNLKDSKEFINEINKKIDDGDYSDISTLVQKSVDSAIEGVRSSISYILNSYKNKKDLPPARREKYAVQNPSINTAAGFAKWTGYAGMFTGVTLMFGFFEEPTLAIGAISSFAAGFVLERWGKLAKNRALRYKKYLRELGNNTVVTIDDLCSCAAVEPETVIKDLTYFIKKDYFKEARIVENNSIFILDKKTYEVYKNNYKDVYLGNKNEENLEEGKVDSALEIGKSYITEIAAYLPRLPENIQTDVTKLLSIVREIFKQIKKDPERIEELSKFMDYYLPTTVSLLKRYNEFSESEVVTESQKNSMAEIEKTISTIDEAFLKLLNEIYGNVAMDINSDITVLITMLKQEGLLDNDFKGEING